jgi:hypothetical protein
MNPRLNKSIPAVQLPLLLYISPETEPGTVDLTTEDRRGPARQARQSTNVKSTATNSITTHGMAQST